MAFMYTESYEPNKSFIASEIGLVTDTYNGDQTKAVSENGKKYIKAGTVYPANGTGAKGIVFETVDMTYDANRPISLITGGRIYENRLTDTLDATAKTELQAMGIVFLTASDATY